MSFLRRFGIDVNVEGDGSRVKEEVDEVHPE